MSRRTTQIYEKACKSRGQAVVTEAVLTMLNNLERRPPDSHGEHSIGTSSHVNAYIVCSEVFDGHYNLILNKSYPYIWRIHRQRAELVRFDVRRLDSLVLRWHELKFDCPESLLDWILLYLSAIPTWLIPIFAQARRKDVHATQSEILCITCSDPM